MMKNIILLIFFSFMSAKLLSMQESYTQSVPDSYNANAAPDQIYSNAPLLTNNYVNLYNFISNKRNRLLIIEQEIRGIKKKYKKIPKLSKDLNSQIIITTAAGIISVPMLYAGMEVMKFLYDTKKLNFINGSIYGSLIIAPIVFLTFLINNLSLKNNEIEEKSAKYSNLEKELIEEKESINKLLYFSPVL